MKNSEFYKFLIQIRNGEIEIENNQIMKPENKIYEELKLNKTEVKIDEAKFRSYSSLNLNNLNSNGMLNE